jgi:hypothetical protein
VRNSNALRPDNAKTDARTTSDTVEIVFDEAYYARSEDEPEEPQQDEPAPEDVVNDWEWRESRRLRRVHRQTEDESPRCEHCRQHWPCTGIQMAKLAEARARGDQLPATWLTWIQNAGDDPHGTRAIGTGRVRAAIEGRTVTDR